MTTDMPRIQFRPGRELLNELLARGEDVNTVARTMIERYLAMLKQEPAVIPVTPSMALWWYKRWLGGEVQHDAYRIIDALERAHVLVERDGYSVELALREVGLTA